MIVYGSGFSDGSRHMHESRSPSGFAAYFTNRPGVRSRSRGWPALSEEIGYLTGCEDD